MERHFTIRGSGAAWWIVAPSGEIVYSPWKLTRHRPLLFTTVQAAVLYCMEMGLPVGAIERTDREEVTE